VVGRYRFDTDVGGYWLLVAGGIDDATLGLGVVS
jgi:hypothetical protein